MWFIGLLCFAAGVFVGYKYPQQVETAVESGKKLYSDVKNKLTKKEAPPSA